MSYSDDSPQAKAGKASGEARRQRAADRRAREKRQARYAIPGLAGHPTICVCKGCEACRDAIAAEPSTGSEKR